MGWYPYQHAMTLKIYFESNREVDWVNEMGKEMIDVTYAADNRSISPSWVSFRLFITQFTCTGFEKDASYRFVSQIIIEMKWREKKMVRRPGKSSTGIPAMIDWKPKNDKWANSLDSIDFNDPNINNGFFISINYSVDFIDLSLCSVLPVSSDLLHTTHITDRHRKVEIS